MFRLLGSPFPMATLGAVTYGPDGAVDLLIASGTSLVLRTGAAEVRECVVLRLLT